MLWVLIASGIMVISGAGDDTFAMRKMLEAMQEAVVKVVQEPERQKLAVENVKSFNTFFFKHRELLSVSGDCLEKADRSFTATAEDYNKCNEGVDEIWANSANELVKLDHEQRQLLTPEEMKKVTKLVEEELK